MAVKGLSIPVFGHYNYNSTTGKVTYSGGMINPHAIEYTLTPESTDNNPLYGDNQIIEFQSTPPSREVTLPPLPPFLVAIETIPPVKSIIATIIPALPLDSPFSDSAFPIPAAHDWNDTKTNKIIDKIPDTNFHVFIYENLLSKIKIDIVLARQLPHILPHHL